MTLEVIIQEEVAVVDVFGAIRQLFARMISWIVPEDESADEVDVEDEDDNKSPPDLGVNVSDNPSAAESLG